MLGHLAPYPVPCLFLGGEGELGPAGPLEPGYAAEEAPTSGAHVALTGAADQVAFLLAGHQAARPLARTATSERGPWPCRTRSGAWGRSPRRTVGPQVAAADARPDHAHQGVGQFLQLRVGDVLHPDVAGTVANGCSHVVTCTSRVVLSGSKCSSPERTWTVTVRCAPRRKPESLEGLCGRARGPCARSPQARLAGSISELARPTSAAVGGR